VTLGRVVIPEPLPDGFALFYTTADFDGRTDDPELLAVLRDRFGIEASLSTCNQIHSAHIHRAPATGECDALFTDQRGMALGIKVADCLPVSLCDPVHRVIANIHSGWRGAAQQITAATLDTLARETAFDPSSSYAYLGPSIRVCCFEVGEEVAAQFDERWTDRARGPKPHIDLVAMTEAVLRARGVANVIDTGLCTRCDEPVAGLLGHSVTEQPSNLETQKPLFHSYRREKRTGRNLAIAAQ
jgi:YfiH family protein